jgi:hypothetical protein
MRQSTFWANTFFEGFHFHSSDAIGLCQGGATGLKSNLQLQVQNWAAHGIAGGLFSGRMIKFSLFFYLSFSKVDLIRL